MIARPDLPSSVGARWPLSAVRPRVRPLRSPPPPSLSPFPLSLAFSLPEEVPPPDTGKASATDGVEGVVLDNAADPAFPTLTPERAPIIAPIREDDAKVPYLHSVQAGGRDAPERERSQGHEHASSDEQEPPRGMVRERTYPAPPLATRDDARGHGDADGTDREGSVRAVRAPNDSGEFRVKARAWVPSLYKTLLPPAEPAAGRGGEMDS